MRTLAGVVLALGLFTLVVHPAVAQRPAQLPIGLGSYGGPGMLLPNRSVQEELKLTKEQVEKTTAASQKYQEKQKEVSAKLRDPGQEAQREKHQTMLKAAAEEFTKATESILTTAQRQRLRQIELQQRGAQAFADQEVQKALKLADDQKEKIKTIQEDARSEMEKILKTGPGTALLPQMMQRVGSVRKESLERVSAILNEQQRKTWKDLIGEPFEMRFEFRRSGTQALE